MTNWSISEIKQLDSFLYTLVQVQFTKNLTIPLL